MRYVSLRKAVYKLSACLFLCLHDIVMCSALVYKSTTCGNPTHDPRSTGYPPV